MQLLLSFLLPIALCHSINLSTHGTQTAQKWLGKIRRPMCKQKCTFQLKLSSYNGHTFLDHWNVTQIYIGQWYASLVLRPSHFFLSFDFCSILHMEAEKQWKIMGKAWELLLRNVTQGGHKGDGSTIKFVCNKPASKFLTGELSI